MAARTEHEQDQDQQHRRDGEDGRTDVTQGAGIGLTVARRIVESHGSHLSLASVVGEGTTIAFTIPRVPS